ELCRLVVGPSRLGLKGEYRGARRRELLRQRRGPVLLLLERLLQLRRAFLRLRRHLVSVVARVGCERGLCLDAALRGRKILLQPARPIALLLQGFAQILCTALRLLELFCLVVGPSRLGLVGGYSGARRRELLRQRRGPVLLLLEGLLQLRCAFLQLCRAF